MCVYVGEREIVCVREREKEKQCVRVFGRESVSVCVGERGIESDSAQWPRRDEGGGLQAPLPSSQGRN